MVVFTGAAVDLGFELFEEGFAASQLGGDLIVHAGVEPVALDDASEPAANLLEVLADLLGLFVGVVLAEALELDLLGELGLALLDDLGVFLRRELAEAGEEAGVLDGVDVAHVEEVVGAAKRLDLGSGGFDAALALWEAR